jgi:hypothetical protein
MRTRIAQLSATTAEREFLLWIRITHPEIGTLMNTNLRALPQNPTEAEIQHAAYLLWLENGQPEGRDLEHWLAAKEMLCHRHGRDAQTRRKAPEIAAPARFSRSHKN